MTPHGQTWMGVLDTLGKACACEAPDLLSRNLEFILTLAMGSATDTRQARSWDRPTLGTSPSILNSNIYYIIYVSKAFSILRGFGITRLSAGVSILVISRELAFPCQLAAFASVTTRSDVLLIEDQWFNKLWRSLGGSSVSAPSDNKQYSLQAAQQNRSLA